MNLLMQRTWLVERVNWLQMLHISSWNRSGVTASSCSDVRFKASMWQSNPNPSIVCNTIDIDCQFCSDHYSGVPTNDQLYCVRVHVYIHKCDIVLFLYELIF